MISKIIMNNIASYRERTSLNTDKKINLVYGLNGSGKTVISKYLQNLKDDEYKDCDVDWHNSDQQKILVYNQKFIENNFYESGLQRGIFTLAKENKKAREAIEMAIEKKRGLENENEDTVSQLTEVERNIQSNIETIQRKIWHIKTEYTGGDRVFDKAGFLDGLKGSQNTLFSHILSYDYVETTKDIEKIREELQEIGEDAVHRESIPHIEGNNILEIEQHTIFQEEIIGSQNSTAAKLIEELDNSHWVRQGLNYIDIDNDQENECPFCQQRTLTPKIKKILRDYFDETYEEKIGTLNNLERLYNQYISAISIDNYKRDFFVESHENEIGRLYAELRASFDHNMHKIKMKAENPSQILNLKSSEDLIRNINAFISNRNSEIEEFNRRINNRSEVIKTLKKEFWTFLRNKYNQPIEDYKTGNSLLQARKKSLEKHYQTLISAIKEQEEIITNNQKQTINIEETIDAINAHLLNFGITDFSITKHDEDFYRIKREYEDTEDVFKSLSEGEKTVISFLYFVELCKGRETQADIKDKIIVIDDPISSLSHMYIFNVSVLIQQTFFEPIKSVHDSDFLQCFVLTHSLYFFHELLIGKNKYEQISKLFRITKNKEKSFISDMQEKEIKNEYESYWQIIRDHTQGRATDCLLANCMRNILEHFFSFIDKEKYNRVLENLDKNKFSFFIRYMNRESHSDALNINDLKELDADIFKDAFRKVFEESDYMDHYNKYMNPEKDVVHD